MGNFEAKNSKRMTTYYSEYVELQDNLTDISKTDRITAFVERLITKALLIQQKLKKMQAGHGAKMKKTLFSTTVRKYGEERKDRYPGLL